MLVFLSFSPLPVLAKAYLLSAEPAENSTVTEPPKKLQLSFNEQLKVDFLAVSVVDSQGKRWDNRDVELDKNDKTSIQVTLQKLLPDNYTVRYRVQALDSLIELGKYSFTVSAPPPPPKEPEKVLVQPSQKKKRY